MSSESTELYQESLLPLQEPDEPGLDYGENASDIANDRIARTVFHKLNEGDTHRKALGNLTNAAVDEASRISGNSHPQQSPHARAHQDTQRRRDQNDYWSNYDGVPLVESSPSWLSESRRTSLDNSNRSSPAPSSQLGELNEQANNAVTPPEWENDLHQLLTANDIDFDTLWCSEYITAIHDFQRDIEPEAQVPAQHMARQTDVNIFMRAILVDWLVKVHYEFKYTPETLFLCVNILDRYLANEPVTRLQFQLVGLAAMCLAAKYEEICSPLIQDLVYIAAKAFDSHQIFDMELKILSSLSFNLSVPTASHFLAGTLQAAGADKICGHLASFLAEMSLPEYWMVEFGGSVIAAAAVYTALETLGRERFPEGLREYCGLTEREIK
mmetsp:Transcript_30920/g.67551  ORF Transcript_30920/g.67551 Transcript_30920/m.67551 type:complete len:384 (+) Transcript_30920:109-1260(+)